MPGAADFTRQEPIRQLREFAAGLASYAAASAAPEKVRAALGQALSARCAGCGMVITGEELLALADGTGDSAKLRRLRLGDCARQTCASAFYTVSGAEHPGLDWPSLLAFGEAPPAARKKLSPQRWLWVKKAALGAVIILLLLIVRQWYLGGTIPLIRVGERFEVDRER